MNVFILSTGRCGSTTFERACRHITNYTTAHESRVSKLGTERLNYPDCHIESDNRLSWFLGRLDQSYGDRAFYVHLFRDRAKVASSYAKRLGEECIIPAYARGIYMSLPQDLKAWSLDISYDYVDTVTANIEHFLKDKTNKLVVDVENGKEGFRSMWTRIGAVGDLQRAEAEFDVLHNAGDPQLRPKKPTNGFAQELIKAARKFGRGLRKIPGTFKNA